jgi:hypothetical protein
MNNAEALEALKVLRSNLAHSASPNMMRAIANQAPIAALVYGLALIDTMAGFLSAASRPRSKRNVARVSAYDTIGSSKNT